MGSSPRIRVVLLTDCLAYLTGGAERQIFELARRLNKDRFEVVICSLETEGQAPREKIEDAGCELHTFPVKRIYGFSGMMQAGHFIRFLRGREVDVLMTYHFSSDIWGAVLGRAAGVPVILSNRRDMGFWRTNRHIAAYGFVNRWVDGVITNARAIKEKIQMEENLPPDKVTVIPNGVEANVDQGIERKRLLKRSLEIADDEIVLMHVAALTEVKGHLALFQALTQIISREPKVILVLVGEGPLEEELYQKAEELGIIEHVIFLGAREDVHALLEVADICVLPSLSEGLSNAILEYMAAAKPVIATNVGGNPELVEDGVTGILVEPNDLVEIRTALLSLIADSSARQRMGRSGAQKISSGFSIAGMVEEYERMMQDFLARKKDIPSKKSKAARSREVAAEKPENVSCPKKPLMTEPQTQELKPVPVKKEEKKLKVLHLISSLGLFGAEQVALNLTRLFQEDGQAVLGAIHNRHNPHLEVVDKARQLGLATEVFPCGGKFDWTAVAAVKKYIEEHNVTLLHTHNYKSDLIGAWAARWAGIPAVSTVHGFTDEDARVGLYERLDRFVLRRYFAQLIVMNDRMLPDFPPELKTTIPNGIDLKRHQPSQDQHRFRARWKLVSSDVVVATVGRLSREKNQLLLLKALYPALRNDTRLKVMIVGDGPQKLALDKYVRSRNLSDQVIMTGLLEDVRPVYDIADVFVLPSLTEGVPMTILEAMAHRVPVVATRVGGVPSLITDGQSGLLVPREGEAELRQRVMSLLRDKPLRQRLAEQAFVRLENDFSEEIMKSRYKAVYERVTGGGPRVLTKGRV